jgi:hypothetical protein
VSTISLIEIFQKFDESPKFLYNKGRYEEARNVIIKIAKYNGINLGKLPIFDKEETPAGKVPLLEEIIY